MDIVLSDLAVQAKFADLVGISRQAVSKKVDDGTLPRGGTYADWLLAYVEKLRENAAGRSGERQDDLTKARIDEANAKALKLNLENLSALDLLVCVEDVNRSLGQFARSINSAIDDAGNRIVESLVSKNPDLEFDDELVFESLRSATARIAKNAQELASEFDQAEGVVAA